MLRRFSWRRFKPRRPQPALDADIYAIAERRLESVLPRHPRTERLAKLVDQFQREALQSNQTIDWLAALIIQAPRAAIAQAEMDKHRHGYHNKQARLYELIDFNDMFVSTVLSMTTEQRSTFAERGKQACDRMCKRANAPCFTNDQWDAIVRGLAREIAIYIAARDSGFEAYMTSRTQDALGIDMRIRDPESRRYINIDCKSPSSFRYRTEELVRQQRLTERELYAADDRGYALEVVGHEENKTQIIVLRILQEHYSNIVHFSFEDTAPIRDRLNQLIRDHGLTDDKFATS